MLKVLIDYPDESEELAIINAIAKGNSPTGFDLSAVKVLMKPEHIMSLRKITQRITVDEQVANYVVALVRATRSWGGLSRGAGPRASIALLSASRALALVRANRFVTPDDGQEMFVPALRHRIMLSAELEIEGLDVDDVLKDILKHVDAPRQ